MVAAKEKPSKEIDMENLGKPARVRFPLPEGGLLVAYGANGLGKSTMLESVQDAITDRKEKRSKVRDGAKSGSIRVAGVTMTVHRSRTVRGGELLVSALDGGRLSIADIVSPPLKGAEEADARRIKALVQVAGVEADPYLFRRLLSNFSDVIDIDELNPDDILVMADQIKRKIEASARSCEGIRDIEKQKLLAIEEAVRDVQIDLEADAGVLQLAFEDAVRRGQDLATKAIQAKRRNAEIADARSRINAAKSSGAQSLEDAKRTEELAAGAKDAASRRVLAAEEELRKARESLRAATDKWDSAKLALGQAEHFHEAIAEWESTVSAGELPVPSDDELATADESITVARQAMEAGAAARAAKVKLAQAESHKLVIKINDEAATKYRDAAGKVDSVLTDLIATLESPLRVESGRLVTDTVRGATFFAELSEGERWRIATKIGINAVKGEDREGLLVIPQEAYQGIQPKVRDELDAMAKAADVVILGAQATDDDEIVVLPYDGSLEMRHAGEAVTA